MKAFDELVSIKSEEEGESSFQDLNVINAQEKCPKFIIGRVQGKTVTEVLEWPTTDYCFNTRFTSKIIRIGYRNRTFCCRSLL